MTPKEKAKELVEKVYLMQASGEYEPYTSIPYPVAKQGALLAVDEILLNSSTIGVMLRKDGELTEDKICRIIDDSAIAYWNEVKQEIENL
jgi:hypothetical protein